VKKSKKSKALFFSFIFFLTLQTGLFLFLPARAVEINYPDLPGTTPPQDFINSAPGEQIPSLYVEYFLNLIIWVSGIAAFFVLVIAGIRYLTSAGKPEAMTSAREYISGAFFGILILFSAYLILEAINPQILVSELPELTPPPTITRTEIPPPPIENLRTAIDIEIPFGAIIQRKIFETEAPKEEIRSPRLKRIRDIANNILDASEALQLQNSALKLLVDQCRCKVTEILSPSLCVANPAPLPCSSDPCGDKDLFHVRVGIMLLQEQNKKQIEKLVEEQTKAENEIRLLKEEIGKLQRSRDLMISCQLWPLNSLADFEFTRDFYLAQNFTLTSFRFWNDIILDLKNDWATFYCPTSGSTWGQISETYIPEETGPSPTSAPEASEEIAACTKTVPVGEIMDRSERIGNKLAERLEKLLSLSRELTNTVDDMHRTVSKCTSQLPKCVSVDDPLFCTRVRCFGPVDQLGSLEALEKIIADTQAACIKECTFDEDLDGDCFQDCFKEEFNNTADRITDFPPCPFDIGKGKYVHEIKVEEMGELLNGIPGLGVEGIRDVVKFEPEDIEANREKIGIVPIIDKVIPKLLSDLDSGVKEPMRTCITDAPTDTGEVSTEQVVLANCESSIGTKTENGILEKCCYKEKDYTNCLGRCYLKSGDEYKQCLLKCLKQASEKTGVRELATCQNKLNFFCCGQ